MAIGPFCICFFAIVGKKRRFFESLWRIVHMYHSRWWRIARIAALLVLGGLMGLPAAQSDINGFGGGANWQSNGPLPNGTGTVPFFSVCPDNLVLTDSMNGEQSSVFSLDQQNVSKFKVQYTYQYTGANSMDANGNPDPADGVTFTIQNDPRGPNVLGGGGGCLGYCGIQSSAGVALNLWHNWVRGSNLLENGSLAPGNTYLDITPVNLLSMDPIQVNLTYDGTMLTEVLLDTTTGDTTTLTYTVDIVGDVGDTMAYVGFTGATGGANSFQMISGFSYTFTGQ
jgi:hypothetical protein